MDGICPTGLPTSQEIWQWEAVVIKMAILPHSQIPQLQTRQQFKDRPHPFHSRQSSKGWATSPSSMRRWLGHAPFPTMRLVWGWATTPPPMWPGHTPSPAGPGWGCIKPHSPNPPWGQVKPSSTTRPGLSWAAPTPLCAAEWGPALALDQDHQLEPDTTHTSH